MDIQFGEVQEAEPNRERRPDQDAQYAVFPVGELAKSLRSNRTNTDGETAETSDAFHIDEDGDAFNNQDDGSTSIPDDELKIYVDLDVFRAMESHAMSNTKVELGGVMLGYQRLDENGVPFVVVTECLQAEHYEASKTNFKFTHDTWSKITDDRANFHPDLEMVGWYHTHPGFGIFLSGMDLFICNNFFSRDLDVALVIDPINKERGWFQWVQSGSSKRTRETLGFYLMTNRYRKDELQFFANVYSGGQAMNFDPRFSNFPSAGGQPVINIAENKRPIFDVAIIAMLLMQFLFLALISWKLLYPGGGGAEQETLEKNVEERVYGEVLSTIIAKQTGDEKIVEKLKKEALANTTMQAELEAQILYTTTLKRDLKRNKEAVAKNMEKVEKLEKDKKSLESNNEILEAQIKDLGAEPETKINVTRYLLWAILGLVAGGLVGGIGFFLGTRKNELYDEYAQSAYDANRSDPNVSESRPRTNTSSETVNSGERLTLGDSSEDAS